MKQLLPPGNVSHEKLSTQTLFRLYFTLTQQPPSVTGQKVETLEIYHLSVKITPTVMSSI